MLSVPQVLPLTERRGLENELAKKTVITEFLNSQAIAQFVQSRCKDVINLVDSDNEVDEATAIAEADRIVSRRRCVSCIFSCFPLFA